MMSKIKKNLADDVELFPEIERNSLQRDDLDLLIAKDVQKAFNPFRSS